MYSENVWAQAMWTIGREGGGRIAQLGRSLISTIALLEIFLKLLDDGVNCHVRCHPSVLLVQ